MSEAIETFSEGRVESILRVADNMAAAASSLNPQNYEVLISCRSELKQICENWEKDDKDKKDFIDYIKSQINDIFSKK